ncbi:resistance protein [Musa troglodytarum]|uniref:Resistance protein n=1 Tax=Musa troglodytarum TaxID=320322 RepID=A0A9E7G9F4_9LILI|nr:resistance protein [Musa troglodytarum]
MAGVDLRHVLLDLLPSSDMTERCRELRIHHHLEKIIPDLWAINAVIWDATMRAGAQPDVEMWMADEGAAIRDATIRAGTQPDVEMWMADAGAAIADVQNLLDRILEWPGRAAAPSNPLLRSCLGIRVAFRLSILQELKEMGRRSKELVRRGSALDLRKEAMDAMDPCDEEYSHVLGEEVVGRDKDRDNIVEILQQNQSSSNGEPFVIEIRDEGSYRSFSSMGKTTVARMIYHHPWVRQHLHHRIWVDVSMDLDSDPVSIGREFARCITGESCDHLRSHQAMWLLVNERLGQRRYLLILNDVYHDDGEEGLLKGKWDELKHKLLHVGGMGSTVIITTKSASVFSRSLDIHGCRDYLLAGLSEEAWIKLVMREALIGSEQDNTCSINFLLQFAEQQYETLESSPLVAKTLGLSIQEHRELQSLVNLKKLCLKKLDELPSTEDARALKLKDKMFLKRLALCWEWWDTEVALATNAALLLHEQVPKNLQPSLAIKNLEIVSYMGQKLPSWLACKEGYLKYLREIKLINLKKCEMLPPLGQLLGLETVEISGMESISAVDDAFYGGTFPSLETLVFSEMPMLERWVKAKGEVDMFPRLERLMLIQCPKFKELHVRLPSTTSRSFFTLSVWLNNDKLLSSEFVGWQKLEGVDELEISGCEELRCLPPGLKHLESLEWLEISRCNNLMALPDWLAQLKSLKCLVVRDCARLSFIPERLKQSPPRFYLTIEGCPRLEL